MPDYPVALLEKRISKAGQVLLETLGRGRQVGD